MIREAAGGLRARKRVSDNIGEKNSQSKLFNCHRAPAIAKSTPKMMLVLQQWGAAVSGPTICAGSGTD